MAKEKGIYFPLSSKQGVATDSQIKDAFKTATHRDILIFSGHTDLDTGALLGVGNKPVDLSEIKGIIDKQKRSPGIVILGGCRTGNTEYMLEASTRMTITYSNGYVDKRAENAAASAFMSALNDGKTLNQAGDAARLRYNAAVKGQGTIIIRDPESVSHIEYNIKSGWENKTYEAFRQ